MPAEVFVASNNVLTDCAPVTQSSYRAVVAGIINAIKAETGDSDQDVADRLGVSAATVNNASNKRGDLSPVTMLQLGRVYGLTRLQPVAAMLQAKLSPAAAVCTSDADLPIGAARGQLFLARALADQRIDDSEIIEGADDIEAAAQVFDTLKWRLDSIRTRRAG
jgi:hypothetical protein